MFLSVAMPACGLAVHVFHEDILVLLNKAPLEDAVAGLLSGGNYFPSAASQLCSAMGLMAPPCQPGMGPSERAQGMASSSSTWEQETSRPRRHIRDSQLLKRGLGLVRK